MNQALTPVQPTRNGGHGGLSVKQAEFVRHVSAGTPAIDSARLAGYANPHLDSWRNMRIPAVVAAIREDRTRIIDGELAGTALSTMRELMTDKANTPASVRFQAAKWTLEVAGHKAADGAAHGLPDPNKNLADMTLDELARFIQAGEQALQVIRSEPIDVTPEPSVSAFSAQHSAQHEGADALDVASLLD